MLEERTELWTVQEFAAWLKITVVAARAMIRRREIPPAALIRVGRRIRLVVAVVRQWVLDRAS
jgi:hypothetical protein